MLAEGDAAALLNLVSKFSQDRKCPGRSFRGHYCSWNIRWPRRKWQGAREVRAKTAGIKNDPAKKPEDKFCPWESLVLRLPRTILHCKSLPLSTAKDILLITHWSVKLQHFSLAESIRRSCRYTLQCSINDDLSRPIHIPGRADIGLNAILVKPTIVSYA